MIIDLRNTAHGRMDDNQNENFISNEENFFDILDYYNSAPSEQKNILHTVFSYDDLNKMLDISYTHNIHGFRSPYQYGHTEKKDTIWVFGDSISYGHGAKYEHTWPHLLSQKLGYKLFNFAKCGSGVDTAIRLAEEWLKKSTNLPKLVISYGYYRERFEIPVIATKHSHHKRYDTYISTSFDYNDPTYRTKMEYLDSLFSSYGVKFYNLDFLGEDHSWNNFYVDFARDISPLIVPILKSIIKKGNFTTNHEKFHNIVPMPHPGPKSHNLICDHIYNVIQNDK